MALEDLLHPHGTALAYSTNSGVSYTDVANLILASPPVHKKDVAMATTMNSTLFHKEKRGSWRDTDDMDGECYFTAAQRATLMELWEEEDIWFRLTYPLLDGEVTPFIQKFRGFFVELGISQAKAEENNLFSCPFKLALSTMDNYSETQPT